MTSDLSGPSNPEYALQPGDRMLIACSGGPSRSRLETFPPPLEVEERGGIYVLIDDGSPQEWTYEFVPTELA